MKIIKGDLAVQLRRYRTMPAWEYTGPLDPLRREALDAPGLMAGWEGTGRQKVYALSKRTPGRSGAPGSDGSYTADTEEEAWRLFLGAHLGNGAPYPDFAERGETLADYQARLETMRRGQETVEQVLERLVNKDNADRAARYDEQAHHWSKMGVIMAEGHRNVVQGILEAQPTISTAELLARLEESVTEAQAKVEEHEKTLARQRKDRVKRKS